MAVRFDADGEDYTRALTLGSQANYTVCCWVKISVDRNTWQTAWSIDNGTGDVDVMQTDSDRTTMELYSDGNNPTFVNMTVGTWYFFGVSRAGTGGTAYYRAATSASLSTVSLAGSSSTTNMATLRIGESPFGGEWLNGCVAAFKFWTVALTQAEIEWEAAQYLPNRLANLQVFYPLVRAETTDYSGNARTLSGGTGVATEDGPPVPWWATPPRIVYIPAGGATHNADASLTSTASITATAEVVKSISATPTTTATTTASATADKPVSASLTATAGITADATVDEAPVNADASLTITASLSGTVVADKPASGTVSATAGITAGSDVTKPVDASLTATSAVTAGAAATKPAGAVLTATAAATGSAESTKPVGAALTGTATITADATVGAAPINAQADLTVTAATTATVSRVAEASGALTATASITASAELVKPIAGTLTMIAAVSAAVAKSADLAAALALTATLGADGSIPQQITRGAMSAVDRDSPTMGPVTRTAPGMSPVNREVPTMTGV